MKSIPLSENVNVNAGSRQSFYVTMDANTSYVFYGGNFTGTGQTTDSSSIQNSDIVIQMGTGNAYPFGRVLTPRFFNGAVTYREI